MHYSHKQKVMFQHCDPAGIVFYPRYFEMINAVVENWFEDGLKTPFDTLHFERGSAVPTATINTRFTAPSRLGDTLDMTLTVQKIGGASLDLTITAQAGEETRLESDVTLVHVGKDKGRPKPWPQDIRNIIETLLEETSP